jgi:hypothetical protein
MELVGEQKRIRELFSELRLADEQLAPRFAAVWNRAQARPVAPARGFNFSFVVVAALLICALVSLALWSKYSRQNAQQVVTAAMKTPIAVPLDITRPPVNVSLAPAIDLSQSGRRSARTNPLARLRRLAAERNALVLAANLKATREATSISSWQSPTTAFLKSQNDELLKSLPQLNESAVELKSFLNTPK